MGNIHLKQMHRDAVEVDCAALPMAAALDGPASEIEYKLFGRGVWDPLFIDQRVDAARKLIKLRVGFSEQLKRMLLEGRITIMGRDSQTGRLTAIKDPNVFDFDDPVLDRGQFMQAFSHFY